MNGIDLCYCVYLCTCALYVHSSFTDSSLNQQTYVIGALMHFMCIIGIKPESLKHVVGFVNV